MNEYPPWGDGEGRPDPVEEYKVRLLSEVEKYQNSVKGSDDYQSGKLRACDEILEIIKEKGA